MFSTAAIWTPDFHLGIRSSVSLGIGLSTNYNHQSQQPFLIMNPSALYKWSRLSCRAEPLTSCEKQPQRRSSYCL